MTNLLCRWDQKITDLLKTACFQFNSIRFHSFLFNSIHSKKADHSQMRNWVTNFWGAHRRRSLKHNSHNTSTIQFNSILFYSIQFNPFYSIQVLLCPTQWNKVNSIYISILLLGGPSSSASWEYIWNTNHSYIKTLIIDDNNTAIPWSIGCSVYRVFRIRYPVIPWESFLRFLTINVKVDVC